MSPNDQMGVQEVFVNTVSDMATKPLLGLTRQSVMNNWGAAISIYPSHEAMGKTAGAMIVEILNGKPIKDIKPEQATVFGVAINLKKTKALGINIDNELLKLAGKNIIEE